MAGTETAAELASESPRSSISTRPSLDEDAPFLCQASSNSESPAPDDRDASESGDKNADDEWAHLPEWRRPSIWWLIVPFCFFTTAFGSIAVPRLNIILALICRQYFADQGLEPPAFSLMKDDKCQNPEVQALVAKFTLVMGFLSGFLGAITSPRLGQLSDRYGRKFFISLSSLGLFSSEVCTVLAALYPDVFSVNIILFGSFLDGLSGSFLLGQAVAASYAADCTPPAKRAVAFGYFSGCLFLGMSVGPALGSLIVKATGNILHVFYFAMASCVFFVLYSTFILPESLSKSRMEDARQKHQIKLSQQRGEGLVGRIRRNANIFAPLKILIPSGSQGLKRNMILLSAIDTVLFGVGIGSGTVILLYCKLIFGWDAVEQGFFLSAVSSTRVVLLFVLLPLIAAFFRRTICKVVPKQGADAFDIFLIRFSVVSEVIGYSLMCVARTGGQFTLCAILVALGGAGSPTIQSTLTKHVSPEYTGQLLGALALLHSLARVLGPIVFNSVYAFVVVRNFPTGVFVSFAATFFIALICCFGIKGGVGFTEEEEESVLEESNLNFEEESD